nr:hypothetical protein [Rhodobaca bogoriensis]
MVSQKATPDRRETARTHICPHRLRDANVKHVMRAELNAPFTRYLLQFSVKPPCIDAMLDLSALNLGFEVCRCDQQVRTKDASEIGR